MNQQTQPTTTPNYQHIDDEIDLLELFNTLWKGKWFITAFTFACTLIAIVHALRATPLYQAEALLAPVTEESGQGGFNALAAQYGGLASLAGINLRRGSGNVNTHIAILKSREFIYRYISENNLMPILFDKLWDSENNRWLVEPPKKKPTEWNAYRRFLGTLSINNDKKNGLVTLKILWKDPQIAAKWANSLVERLNTYIRTKTITEAKKSIEYLEHEIEKTGDVKMQDVLYRLVEKQAQTITLAQVKEQFAFDIIDSAVVPEVKTKPKKRLIVAIGAMTGGVAGIFLWFLNVFIQNIRQKKSESK